MRKTANEEKGGFDSGLLAYSRMQALVRAVEAFAIWPEDQALGKFTSILEDFYPSYYICITLGSHHSGYKIVASKNFPIPDSMIDALHEEGTSYIRLHEVAAKPLFINDSLKTPLVPNNPIKTRRACFIPIQNADEVAGWITVSSPSNGDPWRADEQDWLNLAGRLLGAILGIKGGSGDGAAFAQRPSRENPAIASEKEEWAMRVKSLTRREHEVFSLIIEGLDVSEIAGRLQIEASTVRKHVENGLPKLGVQNKNLVIVNACKFGF